MRSKNDFIELDFSMDEDEPLQEILNLLHEIPPIPVPKEFDLKLKQALQLEKKKKKISILKRWGTAAAVFLVGIVSVFFLNDGNLAMPADLSLQDSNKEIEKAEESFKKEEVSDEVDNTYGVLSDKEALKEEVDQKTKAESLPLKKSIPENNQSEIVQESSSPQIFSAQPSRSFAYAGVTEEFNRYSEEKLLEMVETINQHNSLGSLQNSTCLDTASKALFSNEMSSIVLKLYQDIFDYQQVTYKRLDQSISGVCQMYEVQGNGKAITFKITNPQEGIHISEPILEHGEWLDEQLSNTTYVLQNYELNKDDSVVFHVNVLINEHGENVNEVRSIVWKPTKS